MTLQAMHLRNRTLMGATSPLPVHRGEKRNVTKLGNPWQEPHDDVAKVRVLYNSNHGVAAIPGKNGGTPARAPGKGVDR